MSVQFLPVYRNNAVSEIDEMENSGALDFNQLRRRTENYRIKSIANLLMTGLADGFHEDLEKSALSFVNDLSSIALGSVITSRCTILFDAILVGCFSAVNTLADFLNGERGAIEWQEDYEYLEDYCYYQSVLGIASGNKKHAMNIFKHWAGECEEDAEPRFLIIAALLCDDENDFLDGLMLLLEERRNYLLRMREAEALPPQFLDTEGRVFIEGLALVRLARERGYRVEKEYLFLPSTALS